MAIMQITGTRYVGIEGDSGVTRRCQRNRALAVDGDLYDNIAADLGWPFDVDAVVFDVGAFIGSVTRLFLDLGCRVHAFEPQMEAYQCLIHNCPEATCFNKPVGVRGQRMSIAFRDCGESNFGGTGWKPTHADEGIEVTCLDDFCHLSRCDFVKLDVEGCEPYVLEGGREFFAKYRPPLFVEFRGKNLRRQGFSVEHLESVIASLGYKLVRDYKRDRLYGS